MRKNYVQLFKFTTWAYIYICFDRLTSLWFWRSYIIYISLLESLFCLFVCVLLMCVCVLFLWYHVFLPFSHLYHTNTHIKRKINIIQISNQTIQTKIKWCLRTRPGNDRHRSTNNRYNRTIPLHEDEIDPRNGQPIRLFNTGTISQQGLC